MSVKRSTLDSRGSEKVRENPAGGVFERKMYHMEGLASNLHGTEVSDVQASEGADDALEPEHLHDENVGSGDDEQLPPGTSEKER